MLAQLSVGGSATVSDGELLDTFAWDVDSHAKSSLKQIPFSESGGLVEKCESLVMSAF